MSDALVSFGWQSASRSDAGCVRPVNEDACVELASVGLWAVADGMGGHEAGDVASRLIMEALAAVPRKPRLGELADDVEERLAVVNARLLEMADESGEGRIIGSTVAVLIALRGHGMCIWAGDSRIYRSRAGAMQRLTRDHSEFEDLLDQGLVDPQQAETHPAGNVITRAVGGTEDLDVDSVRVDIADGDRFLLCSDGLYKELDEVEIGRLLAAGSCGDACRALVDEALRRGSRDNVTVVVVHFTEAR